jgi:hypothetical protein
MLVVVTGMVILTAWSATGVGWAYYVTRDDPEWNNIPDARSLLIVCAIAIFPMAVLAACLSLGYVLCSWPLLLLRPDRRKSRLGFALWLLYPMGLAASLIGFSENFTDIAVSIMLGLLVLVGSHRVRQS